MRREPGTDTLTEDETGFNNRKKFTFPTSDQTVRAIEGRD